MYVTDVIDIKHFIQLQLIQSQRKNPPKRLEDKTKSQFGV